MTYDLDFQSHASYDYDPPPTDKLKFNGQWVQKTEWKQTDGKTDGQTDGRYQLLWLPG